MVENMTVGSCGVQKTSRIEPCVICMVAHARENLFRPVLDLILKLNLLSC